MFAAFLDDRVAVVGLGLNNVGPRLEYVCPSVYVCCALLDNIGMHAILYYICSVMNKISSILYQTGAGSNNVGRLVVEFIEGDEFRIDNSLITLRIYDIRVVAINEVGKNAVAITNTVINDSM